VCGIDLELSAGECFGLLGPNGAGKTTTLRLALGLSEPDAGGIRLLDYAIPARALINDPELIVLDEPTTGLDPQARHLIWERLKQLVAHGKTILLTTHFMDEAERLCHRVAVMDNGRIIAQGSPRELVARHIEPQVVEVYGDAAEAWARAAGATSCERLERIGETVFCYTHDDERVLATLADTDELRYLHRRANLEDVFLKLTGRDLRD